MGEVTKISFSGKTMIVIDYTGCNESQMVELVTKLREQLLSENIPQLILVVFSDKTFTTPKFMRHMEKETKEVIHLIDKMAVVGLNDVKKLQLKGYNFAFKRNFKSFASKEEAIAYLIDDTSSDRDLPPYFKNPSWP